MFRISRISYVATAAAVTSMGLALPLTLTCLLAPERGAHMLSAVLNHVVMAAAVLLVSSRVGAWLASGFRS